MATKARKKTTGEPATKARRKPAGATGTKAYEKTAEPGPRALMRFSDAFEDRRFAPGVSTLDYVWVVVMSLGAIGLGIGMYASFFRDAGLPTLKWPNYAAAAGATLVLAYLLFGGRTARIVRVGSLGVATEEDDGKVSRLAWWQISSVTLESGGLRIKAAGKPLTLAVAGNEAAVRRIVSEAMKRIPDRVDIPDAEVGKLGKPSASEGQKVAAEPPQVTGMACRHSDQALTFEKDVRLCSRCAAPYHKLGVPSRCDECGRKLKRS
ncbi:MAG: hypothetical protein R3B72_33320 [Polyangiaceae bacterium]